MNNSISKLKPVIGRTGLSRTTIYTQVKEGTFPKPIRIGRRAIGWLDSEIDDWIDEKIKESRAEEG